MITSSLLVAMLLSTGPVEVAVLCDDVPALGELATNIERELTAAGWRPERMARGEWRHLCNVDHTEALRLVAQAKDDFYDLKIKSARKYLLTAERLVQARLWLDAPPQLQELYLLLGWLELEKRKKRAARGFFRKSLQLWPDWRPRHEEHPPNVKAAFAAVAAKAKRARTGTLVVETNPAGGAQVIVNGFSSQSCPCRLPVGKHFVAVVHPDRGRVVREVRIAAGETLRLELDYERDRRATWALWIAAGNAKALQADAAGTPIVALTGTNGGKPLAVVVRDGVTEISGGDAAAVVAALASPAGGPEVVDAKLVSPSDPAVSPPTEAETVVTSDDSGSSNWWLWTAVAIVGAGLAAGATWYGIWRTEDDVRIRIRP